MGVGGTRSLNEVALQGRQEKVAVCKKLFGHRSLLGCWGAGGKRGETGGHLGAREVWLENLEEEEKKRRKTLTLI